METYLPEEIIFYEIFSLLSVKCLIRLTSVCKRWRSLIRKPGSLNSHLARTSLNLHNSTSSTNSIVVYNRSAYDPYNITALHNNHSVFYDIDSVVYDNNSIVKICDEIFHFDSVAANHINMRVTLIGSVNGLVCFYHSYAKHLLIIWNPVTKFYRTVVKPHKSQAFILLHEEFLFCYDPVNDDIKIMHIALVDKINKKLLRVHIYSCKAESWKEIKDETLPVVRFTILPCVKSRPYPCVRFHSILVAFDFHDEVFRRCPFPESHTNIQRYINWEDSVGKVVCNGSRKQVVYTFDEISSSWLEKYVVPDSLERHELKLCLSNGDIVVDDRAGTLLLFEAKSGLLKNLMNGSSRSLFDVIPYTESLVCIRGMQELSKENNKKDKNRL